MYTAKCYQTPSETHASHGQLFPLFSGALRLFMGGTRVAADSRVRRGQWNHFLTEVGTLEEISALTAPL